MRKALPSLWVACCLVWASACDRIPAAGPEPIRFIAESIQTRTVFADPEENLYPVHWTAGDRAVKIFYQSSQAAEAAVQASADGKTARFEASFTSDGSRRHVFQALSPASACEGLEEGKWSFSVPSVQTPSSTSVDPSAMVLAAEASSSTWPEEVRFHFSHLTAYGRLKIKGIQEGLQSVTLRFSEGPSLTLQTSDPEAVWFGVKPFDASGQELSLTAKTGTGSYTKTVRFPEGRNFSAGQVALFSVDLSDAVFEPDTKSISILAIGNSFSIDAMEYLYGYLQQAGYEEIHLGNLYIGGCTLQTHASNIAGNKNAYTYYTNDTGSWEKVFGGNIVTALKSRAWDYVSMQQASGSSGMPDTYEPYLSSIVETVKTHCPGAKRMWHMTWAYKANSDHSEFSNYGCVQIRMYNAIVDAVKTKVLSRGDFDFVIPCGTAIQNLRTSFIGDTVTRDGYHMSYDVGRVATALMWLKQISGCPLAGIDIKPSNYSLSAEKAAAIKDAVEKAYAHPMEVTASAYPSSLAWHTPDPALQQAFAAAGYDPARYRELPYTLTLHAYYNSTGGSGLSTTASNSNQFAATQFFSREDIPVGSVLVLKSGWQYRPERWTRLSARTSPRPETVTTGVFAVTDAWWSGNAYRAFNLAKNGNPVLTDQEQQELRSCLSIFVPLED